MQASAPRVRPFSRFATYAAASFCLLTMMCALWIIPWRMAFENGGSYYTFGYIPDEIFYAQRLQPLLPGASPNNVINGVTDPAIISQFFLEDVFRLIVSVTGVHVITFFWIFRVGFPVLFFGSILLLARSILSRPTKPWGGPVVFAVSVAIWAGIYFFYDVLSPALPLRNWNDRVPTALEYVLSVLLAWATLRWCKRLDASSGAIVAGIAAILNYIRPYLGLPWMIALVVLGIWLLATRRLKLKPAVAVIGVGILAMLPWLIANKLNQHSETYREWMVRYFDFDREIYRVHKFVVLHEIMAALIALCAFWIDRAWRPLMISCAIAMAAIPFVCGIVNPVARELLLADRFGSFYLVMLGCGLMLILRQRLQAWRGKASWWKARRVTIASCAATFCFAIPTAVRDMEHNFAYWEAGHYESMVREYAFMPAYAWVRQNTPADALFVVDDGFDWSRTPDDLAPRLALFKSISKRSDLFLVLAQRRVIYTDWLLFSPISNRDLDELGTLQRGIFGCPVEMKTFLRALKRFRPGYVLWRKTPCVPASHELAPIPRGLGVQLRKMSDVVYSDSFCEIWKIHYSESEPPGSAPAQ